MRRSLAAALLAVAVAAALLAIGCGGSDPAPVRVGLLIDCRPPLGAHFEDDLAAAQAPLLARGARPAGRLPSAGLRGARVGGRPVNVVVGCSQLLRYRDVVQEARRLVETEHADVVIGVEGSTEGAVLDRVAARNPGTTFVHGWSTTSGLTLGEPPPNDFQPGPTGPQGVAGLATYAYRDLGWRTAEIVADEYGVGWEYAATFGAEFCALGGRIVGTDLASLIMPKPDPAAVRRARAADGVAILSIVGTVGPLNLDGYVTAYGRGRPDLTRRLVLAGPTFSVPTNLAWARDPTGIVVAQDAPFTPNAAGRALAGTIAAAYPDLDVDLSWEGTLRYAQAAEAVIGALEEVGGDLSDGQVRFRAALMARRFASPMGDTRFDDHHQGISTTYLGRIAGTGDRVTVTGFREIPGVDRTVGGLITTPPRRDTPACPEGGRPPPWAR